MINLCSVVPLLSLSHSFCSMAYFQCLFWNHLNQHVYPTINRSFKAKKTSIICANYISRKRCILNAKRSNNTEANNEKKERKVRILIAGGGVGGLVLALAAKQSGFEVKVFEKDLSAVRGEGRHRGPIQLLSSALGILVGIDKGVADQIMEAGCVTGNRVNGLADGLSGDWVSSHGACSAEKLSLTNKLLAVCRSRVMYLLLRLGCGVSSSSSSSSTIAFTTAVIVCRNISAPSSDDDDDDTLELEELMIGGGHLLAKYDLMAPASKAKLPVTIVISRMTLQEILLNAVGSHIVYNRSKVVGFSQDPHKVVVTLDDGRKFEGDILVGADGIWSEVRKTLFGSQEASYSGYTCYSGLAEHVPSYINTIGYRVFLGQNQYFVASDVGNGKMQWYAFHKEAPRSIDTLEDKKERLKELFGCWCNNVTTLIAATREDMILCRDIYDRDMIYSWGIGRVILLGEAAHPMQPNLGQGGCLAIEDCRQLILELQSIKKRGCDAITLYEISSALKRYEQARILRTKIVHVVTRVASKSLSGYKPFIYLWTLRLPVGFP
ncbi:putative zeaxanthin epoxidase [Helianthus debilis subsp. tardiflorus]